jgi:hypothetical protein
MDRVSTKEAILLFSANLLLYALIGGLISGCVETPGEQIMESCHRIQLAAEAFAADNDGEYPDGWEDVSPIGKEFQDYLEYFGGMPENPFETGSDAIVFGANPRPGEVAIEVTGQWHEKYAIRYADRDGKIIEFFRK